MATEEERKEPNALPLGPMGGGGTGLANIPVADASESPAIPLSPQVREDPRYIPGSVGAKSQAIRDRAREIMADRGGVNQSALQKILMQTKEGVSDYKGGEGLNRGTNQGNLSTFIERPEGPGGTTPLYRPGAIPIEGAFQPDYNYMAARRSRDIATNAAQQEHLRRQKEFGRYDPPDPVFLSADHQREYESGRAYRHQDWDNGVQRAEHRAEVDLESNDKAVERSRDGSFSPGGQYNPGVSSVRTIRGMQESDVFFGTRPDGSPMAPGEPLEIRTPSGGTFTLASGSTYAPTVYAEGVAGATKAQHDYEEKKREREEAINLENIKGGYRLKEQEISNKGPIESARIRAKADQDIASMNNEAGRYVKGKG